MFHAMLVVTGPVQHRLVVFARPGASAFPQIARAADRSLSQNKLMSRVIADDPVAPERGHGVDVQGQSSPTLRSAAVAGWSGIKALPAVSRKISFDPRVGVFGTDNVVSGEIVELIATKAVHYARRNAQRAQHDCHGRGKVFAMSLLALEQEIGDGIFDRRSWKLKGIAVASLQMAFDSSGLVEIIVEGAGDLGSELGDSRIGRRESEIVSVDLGWIAVRGGAQFGR